MYFGLKRIVNFSRIDAYIYNDGSTTIIIILCQSQMKFMDIWYLIILKIVE